MRGGFRKLVNPPCFVSEVDLEATREGRQALAEQVRLRQHLERLLTTTSISDGIVEIQEGDDVVDETPVDASVHRLSPKSDESAVWTADRLGRPGPEAA